MRIWKSLIVSVIMLATGSLTLAQTGSGFEDNLSRLVEDNAASYVQPLVTSTGIGLNSGLFRTAKVHKLLGFDVSINAGVIPVTDSMKTYSVDASALGDLSMTVAGTSIDFDPVQLYPGLQNAPTVFGEDAEMEADQNYARNAMVSQIASETGLTNTQVESMYGSQITQAIANLPLAPVPPGILNIGYFPVPSAQVSIGLPMRTEIQVRYLPTYHIDDEVGDLSLRGIGGRISIDQFIPIPLFPIDIAAGAFFQNVELGPATISSSMIHAEVSKSIPLFTVYGGVGLESSKLKVDYTYTNPSTGNEQDISLSVDGENSFRGLVGLRMKLLILSINADYNFGRYNSASLGVGITFR